MPSPGNFFRIKKVWPGDGLSHQAGGRVEVEDKSWGSSCGGLLFLVSCRGSFSWSSI